MKCVFASDIDSECRSTYEENYGIKHGDITKVDITQESTLPEQFIIKQDFVSLRKTFSIHNAPSISNNDINNNQILASKLRNIS